MKKLFTLFVAILAMTGVVSAQTFEWYIQDQAETFAPTTDNVISFSGKHNLNAKYTGTYKASETLTVNCTKGLKVESSTAITIANTKKADIIIVQSTASNGANWVKFDNTALTDANVIDTSANGDVTVKVYSIKDVEAGTHTVGRTSEIGIFYIGVKYKETGRKTLTTPEITYDDNLLVTISQAENAPVRYTIDGANPTAESTLYEAPFTVTDGTVVKAIAIGDGTSTDDSAPAEVTVYAPITEVAKPEIAQHNGTFAITCATRGATIEYSLDGTTYVPYTIPVTLTETTTVSARAKYETLESEVATAEITALPAVEKTSTVILDYDCFTATKEQPIIFEGKGDYAGYSLKMADAPDKGWGYNNNKITINGTAYRPIHGSNGQTITVTIPEGMKATRITLYSIEATAGDKSAWTICEEANPIELISNDGANPDVRMANVAEGTVITFKNSGARPDFVVALDIVDPSVDSNVLVAYEVKGQANGGYEPVGDVTTGTVTVAGAKVNSIALKSGWIDSDNYIKLTTEGGFKKGDILTINGVISNTDETKQGAVNVYADSKENHIGQSADFVNTKLETSAPASEYILTIPADAQVLYISREGNTATHITMIKLERKFELVEPEALADPVVKVDGVAVSDINLAGGEKVITVEGAEAHHIIYYNTDCEKTATETPAAAPARKGAQTLTHEGVVYKVMPAEGVTLDKNGTFNVIAHDPATDARSAVVKATVSGGTTTAISEIEAAQGEAVYYNLQGQKVENPAAGLYIRVAGGKATKVMVK